MKMMKNAMRSLCREVKKFLLLAIASLGLVFHGVNSAPADGLKEAEQGAGGSMIGANPNDPRVAWFREAKFGMFIHWGLYSIPGGVWKGQPVKGLGEWIMRKASIPLPEYAKLADQFNPANFDADAWAQLAQDAGMKYIVITSKHHDGFAMFHSKVSDYNVYDATPWKRDPMKELQAACAKRGIRLCFYYSHAADWHEPNAGGANTLDFLEDKTKDFDQYFNGKAIPQVKELLSNYGPIGLIWFDWPGPFLNPERSQRMADAVHSIQPNTLINSRVGPKKPEEFKDLKKVAWDIRSLGDNHVPPEATPGIWETAATINDSWGYRERDRDKARTPEEIYFQLVDVVSKGGNLLLNVGPDSAGVIPPVSQACLRRVGDCLKINGEAIYGAGPTPFGPEFGAYVPGGIPDKEGKKPFAITKDWRCTTKPGKLFIHLFKWPEGSFALDGVKEKITRAYLLSDKNSLLKVVQEGGNLKVTLPVQSPVSLAPVLVLEY